MVLKLVGFSTSNCTRRVAVVLAEKKVPFEFIPVDWMNGALKSPDFLEKQPFGQAPYIVRLDIILADPLLTRSCSL